MTQLEAGLFNLVTTYGVPMLIIACTTILLIGILKYFDVFRKVPKDNRKPIYYILTYLFVFGITAAYYAIVKQPFTDYVAFSIAAGTAVNILYPLYENLKLRDLLGIIGNFIVSKVAKKQVTAAKENKTNAKAESNSKKI